MVVSSAEKQRENFYKCSKYLYHGMQKCLLQILESVRRTLRKEIVRITKKFG